MHQTFYIDIDEEITSIVDRLRKSKADEIVIVVPKRALLIQSIVNLKLLKKESENLKKQIMIVTQDKLGKLLIDKAGILVQQKLDEGLEDVLAFEDEKKEEEIAKAKKNPVNDSAEKTKELGSPEYFTEINSSDQEFVLSENNNKIRENADFEKITNKELVTGISRDIKKKKSFFGNGKDSPGSLDMTKNSKIKEENYLPEVELKKGEPQNMPATDYSRKEKTDEKLEKFYYQPKKEDEIKKIYENNIPKADISRKFRKFFLSFGAFSIVAILFIGAYLFLPKASLKIYAKSKTDVLDSEIRGNKSINQPDFENEKIPVREIAAENEISQKFNSSGSKSVSNQKAKGTITIYNEYSSSPQQLVATTRFLSADGKLFRIPSGITIPGTVKEGNETKPGIIEAEVVADEPGEEYNIGPSTFSIPGFKDSGNEKYTKFYAKSTKSMAGGGKGNDEIKIITQGDIDNAKNKLVDDLNEKLKRDLKEKAGSEMIVLDEALSLEDAQYTTSNSVGEASDSFSLTLKSKAKALIFKEADLKNLINEKIIRKGEIKNLDNKDINLEFGKTDADFGSGELAIRVHSVLKIGSKIDLDNLKKGILGKDEEELKAYLSSYEDIEKIELNYWPPYLPIKKIPMYEKRVEVTLDNI